jgi:DNA invertase Pin-like site-specific DNA recombinase
MSELFRYPLFASYQLVELGARIRLTQRSQDEFVEHRGWQLAGEYVDLGISGSKDRRPQLDRLMADARRREFDAVLVWKFDRFARSVSHLPRAMEIGAIHAEQLKELKQARS